ncbi:hypothetical protein DPMN_165251 [Dreissena polymorpha]|nr:hypothetical protein DPMN_165251 [Dreissena polymorpha]
MASAEPTFCRDEIIRGNLLAFQAYIELCIKPTDLLKLPFYSKEQRKQIFNNHEPKVQQVRRGLDILHNEIRDPGKYAAFQDLMAGENGYPKIAAILNGEIVPSDEHYRKLLDLFSRELIKRMSAIDLLPHLLEKETITDEDAQTVRAQCVNNGITFACWELLFALPLRKEDWFKDLMVSLIDVGTPDIAELLEPDMFAKIMAQRPPPPKEVVDIVSFVSEHNVDNDCTGAEHDIEISETTDLKARGSDNESTDVTLSEGRPANDSDSFDAAMEALLLGDNLKDPDSDVPLTAMSQVGREDSHETQMSSPKEPKVLPKAQVPQRQLANNIPVTNEAVDGGANGLDTFSAEIDEVLLRDTSASGPMLNTGATRCYKREFLIKCNGTAATRVCPPGVRLLPEIYVPITNVVSDEENDLIADSSDDDDEAKEINIETDVDAIDKGKEDKDVELFDYQKELAKEGCEGENVVIMAPTNSGKTYVGSRIMQVHLRRQKAQALLAKVIFLVENEALAFQQGKLFAEKLPAYRTKVFTGSVQREKQQYLWDFLASRDILVVTAQVLVNALKTGHIQSLTQFSLIVFDECHHSNKQHMYNEILWKYIEMKLQPGTDVAALPQVVGLTASLGVGGSTDWEAGLKHMKNILANMDAKFLCTVRNPVNKEELKKRTNCPIEEPVPVQHRAHDRFAEAIMDVVKQIDDLILESCDILDHATMDICRIPLGIFGTERYLQWNAEFVKNTIPGLRVDLIRRILNPCRRHLEAYNKALMIHKDARIMDAIRILEDFMKEFREVPEHVETDARLINFYDGMMLSDSFDDEPENPKLVKMGQILQDVLVADNNARGIIFVKTRELAKALVSWINETDYLKILQASEFVGQNAATSKGGMTKCKQKDALEYFKGGRHRVIIATSVAEEGLDIQKCNLVIRYEHVTNEIVRLQSRGRARADFSRYLVISEEGSWILDKEEKNRRCEELMNKIVPHLQAFIDDHANLWENELLQLQTEMKEERDREKERRRLNMVNEVEFQCLNCSAFICMSDDIKCIKGAHHIITDPEADERLRLERDTPYFVEPEGAEYGGQVYCAKVSCQVKLGSICTYKYMDFPLISLKAFRVVKPDGTGKSYKVWKKVPCEIADFTFDDLRDVIDIRLNNLV